MSNTATVTVGGYQMAHGPVVKEHQDGTVTVSISANKNVTGWPVGRGQQKS